MLFFATGDGRIVTLRECLQEQPLRGVVDGRLAFATSPGVLENYSANQQLFDQKMGTERYCIAIRHFRLTDTDTVRWEVIYDQSNRKRFTKVAEVTKKCAFVKAQHILPSLLCTFDKCHNPSEDNHNRLPPIAEDSIWKMPKIKEAHATQGTVFFSYFDIQPKQDEDDLSCNSSVPSNDDDFSILSESRCSHPLQCFQERTRYMKFVINDK